MGCESDAFPEWTLSHLQRENLPSQCRDAGEFLILVPSRWRCVAAEKEIDLLELESSGLDPPHSPHTIENTLVNINGGGGGS